MPWSSSSHKMNCTVLYKHLRDILARRIDQHVARVQVRGDLVYRALAPQHRHPTTGNLLQCVVYASAFPAIPRCWQLTHQKLKNGDLTDGWWLNAMATVDPHVMFSCHTPLFLHLCTFEWLAHLQNWLFYITLKCGKNWPRNQFLVNF